MYLHCAYSMGILDSVHGDAMIDIEQLCIKANETDAWDDNDAVYYALGCLKPNYPMPAIPYKVVWPWDWHQKIGAINACYVIRVEKQTGDYWEGSFACEWPLF